MMTLKTLAWCRDHDWGADARLEDGVIVNLLDATTAAGGSIVREKRVSFSDRRALHDWAGY